MFLSAFLEAQTPTNSIQNQTTTQDPFEAEDSVVNTRSSSSRLTRDHWCSHTNPPQLPPSDYMQPAPIQSSTRTQNLTNQFEPASASQYGLRSSPLHHADSRDSPDEDCGRPASPNYEGSALATIESAKGQNADLQEELLGLSSDDAGETKPRPPFQRIFDHENALLSASPKRQEGLAFRVVKKKGNNHDGPQLEDFPAGMRLSCGWYMVINFSQKS